MQFYERLLGVCCQPRQVPQLSAKISVHLTEIWDSKLLKSLFPKLRSQIYSVEETWSGVCLILHFLLWKIVFDARFKASSSIVCSSKSFFASLIAIILMIIFSSSMRVVIHKACFYMCLMTAYGWVASRLSRLLFKSALITLDVQSKMKKTWRNWKTSCWFACSMPCLQTLPHSYFGLFVLFHQMLCVSSYFLKLKFSSF